jgi:hypothetical protein
MGLVFDKQPSSRLGVSYVFTASGSSQATSTFGTQTYQIRLATTSGAVFLKVGQSGVVADSTSGHVLGTNITDYFVVSPEQAAVVGSGVCTISEMS